MQAKVFALYKTKLGLDWMNKIAKIFPRAQKVFWNTGVVVGFLGMGYILYVIVKETIKLIFVPGTAPALAPVLPGIDIPGAPALSFWHWVITIFVAAVIHEFSHGIVARLHNIKVKSSGFAFLGPILAAFVEPDEKVVPKKKPMEQMSMFAAGPFSNIILGALLFVFLAFVFAPVVGGLYDSEGITVNGVMEGYPMADVELDLPFTILSINEVETLNIEGFYEATGELKPGDEVSLVTDQGEVIIVLAEHPDDSEVGFFGISELTVAQELKEDKVAWEPYLGIISWLQLLIIWLFLINVGIGLFNLLPLGPVDGGRMFHTLMLVIFKDEKIANKLLGGISLFVLGLIVINMIPWLVDFFTWIGGLGALLLALL